MNLSAGWAGSLCPWASIGQDSPVVWGPPRRRRRWTVASEKRD